MTKRPALEALDAAMLNPVREPKRKVCRSSITGRFVSVEYAAVNPATTQCEVIDG